MPDFSEEEITLMSLYHTGTRQGLDPGIERYAALPCCG